jgi:hypothetical protein
LEKPTHSIAKVEQAPAQRASLIPETTQRQPLGQAAPAVRDIESGVIERGLVGHL